MKLAIPNCPHCGEPAIGTAEVLVAVAQFTDIDENGCTHYGGYTQVSWDDQRTKEGEQAGTYVLQCADGHQWDSAIEGLQS